MIAVVIACALLALLGIGAALLVLGAGRIARGRDDLMAVADAVHECRACSPEDWGACTCKEFCGSIRCTAWDDAMYSAALRIVKDTKENTQ